MAPWWRRIRNEEIEFPPELEFIKPLFVRFARPSRNAVWRAIDWSTDNDRHALTLLSIRLSENGEGPAGFRALLAHADRLEAAGQKGAAKRIRGFAEGILPIPG